jgi:predicted nucleic-acid-binding protein
LIGLDSNVLVRYFTQDDKDQSARATRLVEGLDEDNQGFVSLVALVELHWVLRRAYKVSRDDATGILRKLLNAQELVVQEPDAVRRALTRVAGDIDFSDALISELDTAAGCVYTATFDGRAARLVGMELVPEIDAAESG